MAKFIEMSDDLEEIYIPYDRIIAVLQENNWDGYVLSEYEGFHRGQPGVRIGSSPQAACHVEALKSGIKEN